MPYIPQERREVLKPESAAELKPENVGELNYAITAYGEGNAARILVYVFEYIRDKKISYTLFNEVMGVLACARYEHKRRGHASDVFDDVAKDFYRGFVAPYEDLKMQENGDVRPFNIRGIGA